MNAHARLAVALCATLVLSGCDDVIGFDVADDGRVLVALDASGKVELLGDGMRPRDLFLIDTRTAKREKLGRAPLPLGAPRARAGGGAVAVEGRRRLVIIEKDKEPRALLEAAKGNVLLLPAVSPDGARAAVVEAKGWREKGTLHVIDVASGAERARLDGVLPGAAWVGAKAGALVVARARELRLGLDEAPAKTLPSRFEGELVKLDDAGKTETLGRGTFSIAAPIGRLGERGLVVLPAAVGREDLALAFFDLSGGGALRPLDLGKGSVAFASASPDAQQVLLTRSGEDQGTLEGTLLLAPAGDLAAAKPVPAPPGPVSAPRWVAADRIVFLVGDALVAQGLRGEDRVVLGKAVTAEKGGKDR